MPKHIDSPKNPTVKTLARLKNKRWREREGRFLIEGARELTRALEAGYALEQVVFAPAFLKEAGAATLDAVGERAERLELSQAAFSALSLRQKPDGVIGVASTKRYDLAALQLPRDALILVIDGLEKPGNVGALLRTADAGDIDAVLLSGNGTDLYNPNVIRASMGSVFSRPVVAAETETLLGFLQAHKFAIVAATPAASQLYWETDLTGPTALVLGTEHGGLGEDWLGAATRRVAIPMHGLADSLNVSVAGALLVYEALRQRARRAH